MGKRKTESNNEKEMGDAETMMIEKYHDKESRYILLSCIDSPGAKKYKALTVKPVVPWPLFHSSVFSSKQPPPPSPFENRGLLHCATTANETNIPYFVRWALHRISIYLYVDVTEKENDILRNKTPSSF